MFVACMVALAFRVDHSPNRRHDQHAPAPGRAHRAD
jgi:hypothetical protein